MGNAKRVVFFILIWVTLSVMFTFIGRVITDIIRVQIYHFKYGINDGSLVFAFATPFYSVALAIYLRIIYKRFKEVKIGVKFIFLSVVIPIIINVVVALIIASKYGFFNIGEF